MENAKQKAIRLAYVNLIGEEKYNQIKNKIDENGVCSEMDLELIFGDVFIFDVEEVDAFENGYDYAVNSWRPKSLQGIETNNGWIKIESEKDLPSEDCDYWCGKMFENGKFYQLSEKRNKQEIAERFKTNVITHYQPIVKPLKPIY